MRCMFYGHRKVWEATIEVAALAKEEIQKLVSNGVNEFWTGGMGEFDHICKHFVLELRKSENLQLKLVLPYITQKANKYKDLYGLNYNEIIIPDLPDVHYKRKITLRNRWMVEQCDCILAYVWREGGGARQTLQYAASHSRIQIINLADRISTIQRKSPF